MDDYDVNLMNGLPDSQPLFTEKEDILTLNRRHLTLEDVEEFQSQSLLSPKRRKTENSGMKSRLITVPQSEDIQKSQEELAVPNQNSKKENVKHNCVLCNHDFNKISNQRDLRNEYYGKLISSELQFVKPCMRTYVYVEILKLIHRNKYRHMPVEDTE